MLRQPRYLVMEVGGSISTQCFHDVVVSRSTGYLTPSSRISRSGRVRPRTRTLCSIVRTLETDHCLVPFHELHECIPAGVKGH